MVQHRVTTEIERKAMRKITDTPEGERMTCTAMNKQGKRCRGMPIAGGTVCRFHGGGAPQVKRKAALRLLELVDPAIATLAREMATATKSADRQRAANSILDRAGITRKTAPSPSDARDLLLARLVELRASSASDEFDTINDAVTTAVNNGRTGPPVLDPSPTPPHTPTSATQAHDPDPTSEDGEE